jgi:hypothetical protein
MREIFAAITLLAGALTASAQNTATFEWQGEIQQGLTLEIRNINGDIRAEAATGPLTEILVRIAGTRPSPDSVKIDIVPHAGGLIACTIYEGLSEPNYCAPDMTPSVSLNNSDVRVDYTVRVPAGVRLAAKTVNGRIQADLPDSPIFAETVNGRIVLSGKDAEAQAVNGSILAALAGVDWEGVRKFRTVNGAVDVELPAAASATVRANLLFGLITTDFPIPVHRGFVGSWMHGDINGGGPKIVMSTVNGSIHLRKAE